MKDEITAVTELFIKSSPQKLCFWLHEFLRYLIASLIAQVFYPSILLDLIR